MGFFHKEKPGTIDIQLRRIFLYPYLYIPRQVFLDTANTSNGLNICMENVSQGVKPRPPFFTGERIVVIGTKRDV